MCWQSLSLRSNGPHCPTVGPISVDVPYGNDSTNADACSGTNLWPPIGLLFVSIVVLPYGNTFASVSMQVSFSRVFCPRSFGYACISETTTTQQTTNC